MAKKESLKINENLTAEPVPKVPGLSSKAFGIIKFILGLLLLPVVYFSTVSFLEQFMLIRSAQKDLFCQGIVAYLIVYLFIWKMTAVYLKGHQFIEIIFSFFRPLVNVAPYLVPVYTLLLFVVYGITCIFIKTPRLIEYAIFLFGFTTAFHLVLSAESLRQKKGDFLKGSYIFGFSFVYLVNLVIVAMCINFLFTGFSFFGFLKDSYFSSQGIFLVVFRQLFRPQ